MTGSEMRILRERLGITQAELARSLNKSIISINRWENTGALSELPDDVARLLDGLKAVADSAEKKPARLTKREIREALLSQAGVIGVIVAAARAGLIPRVLLACIIATPGLGWIAIAAGIGAAAVLPFFQKTRRKKGKDTDRYEED
jgi:transcriptional regulator with XRE-family HTH domain